VKLQADIDLARKESQDLTQQLNGKDKVASQLEEQLKTGTNQLS
jgi:hypothetical protein